MTKRQLLHICFNSALGMTIEASQNVKKLEELGYIRFIVWRTKRLYKMFDFMLNW